MGRLNDLIKADIEQMLREQGGRAVRNPSGDTDNWQCYTLIWDSPTDEEDDS